MSDVTTEALRLHCSRYLPGECLEITAIPQGENLITKCATPEEAIFYAAEQVEKHGGSPSSDLYMGSNPIRAKRNSRPKLEDISRNITTLIDLDPMGTEPRFSEAAEAMAREIESFIRMKIEPDGEIFGIATGRGAQIHLYHEDLGEDHADVKPRLLVGLGYLFDGADVRVDTRMHNRDRLMRLPGSVNTRTGRRGRILFGPEFPEPAVLSESQMRELLDAVEDDPRFGAARDAMETNATAAGDGHATASGLGPSYIAACREMTAKGSKIPLLDADAVSDRRERAITVIINAVRAANIPQGCGHYSILALTGYLMNRGLASDLVQRVCIWGVRPTNDEKAAKDLRKRCAVAAASTRKKIAESKKVWGGKTLSEFMGQAAFQKLRLAVNALLTIDNPGWSKAARIASDMVDSVSGAGAGASTSDAEPGEPSPPSAPKASAASPANDRPTIVVTPEITDMVNEVEAAILGDPSSDVFHSSGALVRVRPYDSESPPGIEPYPEDALFETASRVAYWISIKETKDGPQEKQCGPPRATVKALMARGTWLLRPLNGVIEAPCMRKDGTILGHIGYDRSTGLLFQSQTEFPKVSVSPTWDDAQAACRELAEPFSEFPFIGPEHLSACLAAVMSVVGREAIEGPVPLFGISAPTPGTGKSLAADIVSLIATGREAPKTPPVSHGDEDRKRILSLMLAGSPVICIDNIEAPFGSDVMASLLTSSRFSDRVLGESKVVNVPVRAVWFATGNNLRIKGDLGRRCVPIRIDAVQERPEEREDFVRPRPELIRWCRAERGRLVAAALTVLRAYVVAGSPSIADSKALGSFEQWDRVVRRALIWAGMSDPLGDRDYFREEGDPEAQAYRELIVVWRAKFGDNPQTIREACRAAINDGELRDAIAAMDQKLNPESLDARRVAAVLRKYKGRVSDGLVLDTPTRTKAGASYLVRLSTSENRCQSEMTSTSQAPAQDYDTND